MWRLPSDLHNARNDWGGTTYPVVPGHKIIGRVTAVGPEVTRYKVGDHVAVGCLVDSCQHCDQCHHDHEQFCREGRTDTYGAFDRVDGTMNMGGYSKHLIAREEFVLRVPEGLDVAKAGPLLDIGGTLVLVGQVGPVPEVNTAPMVLGQRHISGSLIGGIAETQEVLDYCARKNILPDVEIIRMDEINTAFERMERSDVHHRFVIDMASLDAPQP